MTLPILTHCFYFINFFGRNCCFQAALEIFYGVGYIVGPTIGGFLYTLGGYILPFSVMGGVLLGAGLFVFFILPAVKRNELKPKGR